MAKNNNGKSGEVKSQETDEKNDKKLVKVTIKNPTDIDGEIYQPGEIEISPEQKKRIAPFIS